VMAFSRGCFVGEDVAWLLVATVFRCLVVPASWLETLRAVFVGRSVGLSGSRSFCLLAALRMSAWA
jgi:hypothetical protein